MLSDTYRTCPRCKTDESVKHICTRVTGITFACTDCRLEWTVRFAPEPRPVFDPRRLPAEAA